jgi:outer membrane protein assembly factor BamE
VRFVLGTPLVADVFHPDRWDYVFRFQHANGEADLRHASVFFESDRVKRVTQVDLPARDDPNDPALPGARARRAQK